MDIAYSVDGVPIRLTSERWFHIVENHDDLAGHYDDVLDVIMEKRVTSTIAKGTPVATAPIFGAVPYLIRFPSRRFWVDYDEEADVLYISFRRPQKATDSEITDEGILLRYRGDELVGITVLDVSAREAA